MTFWPVSSARYWRRAHLPSKRLQPGFWELRRYSMFLFIVLMFSGVFDRTIFPVMHAAGGVAGEAASAITRSLGG